METYNSVKLSPQEENESNYMSDVNKRLLLGTDLQEEIRKDVIYQNEEIQNNINTNVSDYSVEDIFNLLDMEMDELEDYDDMKTKVNSKIEKYVGKPTFKLICLFPEGTTNVRIPRTTTHRSGR